ncbi:MAG TPA: alpha/beta hydrolase [Bryobacteraceae bacterium]|nr:alpha/beta hydrolase [Bryobacteraceae bacterium]
MAFTSIAAGAEFALDGNRVWYEASGSGEPAIVMVHGWSCDSSFWRLQRPALEKRYRVLALDLPGHGKSDKPEMEYSVERFSRAVQRLLDAEKVSRAVLVGHSMGAMVIRQTLADDPKRVIALISIDGTVFSGVSAGLQKWAVQFASALRGSEHDAAATKFIEAIFRPSTPPALRQEIRTKMLSTPAHVAASAMEKTLASEMWAVLPPATVPALAINARSDRGDRQADHAKLLPNLEYHELDGVSHFLMLEKPDEVNRLIMDFVRRLQ